MVVVREREKELEKLKTYNTKASVTLLINILISLIGDRHKSKYKLNLLLLLFKKSLQIFYFITELNINNNDYNNSNNKSALKFPWNFIRFFFF